MYKIEFLIFETQSYGIQLKLFANIFKGKFSVVYKLQKFLST